MVALQTSSVPALFVCLLVFILGKGWTSYLVFPSAKVITLYHHAQIPFMSSLCGTTFGSVGNALTNLWMTEKWLA